MDVTKLKDNQLVKKIKKSADSNCYLELKRRNEKSYFKTCSSYVKKCPQLSYEELIEDCDLVIHKSILSYNPRKKTKFSSWVTSMSRFHVLNTIKSKVELSNFICTENTELDSLKNTFNNIFSDKNEDLKNHIFSIIGKMKDERLRIIFEERFYGDKESRKWGQIATKLNLSTQQISNIYKTAREKIYQEMTKEEYNK